MNHNVFDLLLFSGYFSLIPYFFFNTHRSKYATSKVAYFLEFHTYKPAREFQGQKVSE